MNQFTASRDIRYAVYIWKRHADRSKDSLDILTDIWKYWYGMTSYKGHPND